MICVTCPAESCLSLSESWFLLKGLKKWEQILLVTSVQLVRLHTVDPFRCKLKSEFASTYIVLVLWRAFLQLKFKFQPSKIQVAASLLFWRTLPAASCPWLFVEPFSFLTTFQIGSIGFPWYHDDGTEVVAHPLCSIQRWLFNEVQKNPQKLLSITLPNKSGSLFYYFFSPDQLCWYLVTYLGKYSFLMGRVELIVIFLFKWKSPKNPLGKRIKKWNCFPFFFFFCGKFSSLLWSSP